MTLRYVAVAAIVLTWTSFQFILFHDICLFGKMKIKKISLDLQKTNLEMCRV